MTRRGPSRLSRPNRPRRATVLFAEAVLAVTIAAGLAGSPGGYLLAGIATVVGVAFGVRRRGRGLLDVLRDRLRDPGTVSSTEVGTGLDAGVARSGLPVGLAVTELTDRTGRRFGVVGDGQGFVSVLVAERSANPVWPLTGMVGLLQDDPARPAAVQLLVEQQAAEHNDPDYGPSRAYASLPVRGLPLWNRTLLVIRHEPAWTPETARARGGGAAGARAALAAITARAVVRAAREGVELLPADAAEATRLLAAFAVPTPAVTLSVPLRSPDTVGAVLSAAAEQGVGRSVLSVAVSAVDHSTCGVLRLADDDPAALAQAASRLAGTGLVDPIPNAQQAGLIATLPLGGGARSLAALVAQESR